MRENDKVSVIDYGMERTGVIARDPYGKEIVWVKMDDSGHLRWFHKESVTVVHTVWERSKRRGAHTMRRRSN